MGLLSLTYRRPSYVSFEQFRRNQYSEKDDESLSSSKSGVSAGIPDGVSFDNIISGKTCPVRQGIASRSMLRLMLLAACHSSRFYELSSLC